MDEPRSQRPWQFDCSIDDVSASIHTPKYFKWAWVGAAILTTLIVILWLAAPALSGIARERIVEGLKQDFASQVEVGSLNLTLFPRVRISGEGLVFRYNGRTDVPPLVTIRKFSGVASIVGLFRRPAHIKFVRLEGLEIQVPPSGERMIEANKSKKSPVRDISVDEIVADGTTLTMIPSKEGKDPLQWEIQRLRLFEWSSSSSASFQASLTNAKPPGTIESKGKFGPWQREDPDQTPVSGNYTFRNADLSVFRGISGTLSSEGSYGGVLGRIETQGHTDTPDFTVTVSGNPVHLTCEFQAVVDGTGGDTWLQPVTAHFGHSSLTAQGSVVGTKGVKGKTVSLDVTAANARLEDLLLLGVKGHQSAMNGRVDFHTRVIVPPGDIDMAQKLQLNGSFDIDSAHFSNLNVQDKVNELSHRGRGKPEEPASDAVASDFSGHFALVHGLMSFHKLSFRVPGIGISLDGRYNLVDETLDLHGTARLEAKLSETTTGWKSFLLKAADPIFKRKDAGAVLPIVIGGTSQKPTFGLDLHRR